MNNNYLTNSFLYSDEWNSFMKSYKSMMEVYRKSIASMSLTIEPTIKSIKDSIKIITPTYVQYIQQYNSQISKIINSSAINEILNYNLNITRISINEALRGYNWKNVLENYSTIINDINMDEITINEDGTVNYEDEEIQLNNKDVDDVINTLKSIEKNTDDIKGILSSKKSIIIIVIIFIISGICSGFFNKCGETIFDLIPQAFNNYIKEDESNTKKSFIANFRIVNANELNVREFGSSESRIIGKLYLNQCVEVLEKINYWTKVKYINKEKDINIVGWVYTRYLSYIDEETSTLIEE